MRHAATSRVAAYFAPLRNVRLLVLLLCVSWASSQAAGRQLELQTTWAALQPAMQLTRAFGAGRAGAAMGATPGESFDILKRMATRKDDAALIAEADVPSFIPRPYGGLECACLGRFGVEVVVNSALPLRNIALEDLKAIFHGQKLSWHEVPGASGAAKIELYSPLVVKAEGCLFRKKVLKGAAFAAEITDADTRAKRQKAGTEEVLAAVAKEPHAIGFCLFQHEGPHDKRVRTLGIVAKRGAAAVLPTAETLADGSYPLQDTLRFCLHAESPPAAREFVRFATGPEGAKIVKQFGLWPEYELEQVRGRQRLAEVKAGKGAPVTVVGVAAAEGLLKDLAAKYVEAKAAVQLHYQKAPAAEAAEKFPGALYDLMVTDGGAESGGERAESGGERAVGGEKGEEGRAKGETALTPALSQGARGIALGRMAVGIVVHGENPLESLPMDELRGIFCGQIEKWPGVRGAGAAMKVYGLPAGDACTALLAEKLGVASGGKTEGRKGKGEGRGEKGAGGPHPGPLPKGEGTRALKVTALADSAKVIVAVARDPAAIGFVDLSQLPPNEKSVKLVRIIPEGQNGKQAAGDDDYVLAKTLTLYVSPKAGEAAKDFVAFVTPERCAALLAEHRLLPAAAEKGKGGATAPAQTKPAGSSAGEPKLAASTTAELLREFARSAPKAEETAAGGPVAVRLADPDTPAPRAKPSVPPKAAQGDKPGTSEAGGVRDGDSAPAAQRPHSEGPAAALSDNELAWIIGGASGLLVLTVAVGWLSAPRRKKKRRE